MPLRIAFFALMFAASPAAAQFDDPVKPSRLPKKFAEMADVRVEVSPPKVKPGEIVTIKLSVDLKRETGAYTYPFFQRKPGQATTTKFGFSPDSELTLLPGATDPPGLEDKQREGEPEGVFDAIYKRVSPTWEFKAQVSPTAKPGKKSIPLGKTSIQVCSEVCITANGDQLPLLELEVLDAPPVSPPLPDSGNRGGNTTNPTAPAIPAAGGDSGRKRAKPSDAYTAELAALAEGRVKSDEVASPAGGNPDDGLLAFVTTAALWGLISLVTPCVFPMIPITVSIFLKHAHGSLGERMKLAGVYCLTIIAVLGLSAFALLRFMAVLSAHPLTNILLALLFLVLALSLFGMYELTLPSFMARRLQAKQSQGGTLGMVFGALAFTVISFTCVAPFLGGFAGISAADSGNTSLIVLPTMKEVLGGLAFATAFAAPFFVLAMVPGLLKALPKSGGWLDSVKVVMGFLELAAALKFLRTAELRMFATPQYFTYELVLAGWVAISFASALYLFNAYRLPHDEEKPHIGVPRLLFALLFLGLGFYLLPATFKTADGKQQRPSGAVYAWVEAFLLPEPEAWGTDLKETLERSGKSGRPVFIDFTGVTCTNCKYNEFNIFPQQAVKEQLERFERVQLYTDEVPASAYSTDPGPDVREAEASANRTFQTNVFGDIALPLYAVVVPRADGKMEVVGKYDEGKINSPDKFAQWLRDMQEKAKAKK